MNAIELLKNQHQDINELFERLELCDDADKKEELAAMLADKLNTHMTIEEQIFYPAVREDVDKERAIHSEREHRAVKPLLLELLAMPGDDIDFDDRVLALKEKIDHHVKEEEGDMFTRCERMMSTEELLELGREMMQLADENGDPVGRDEDLHTPVM